MFQYCSIEIGDMNIYISNGEVGQYKFYWFSFFYYYYYWIRRQENDFLQQESQQIKVETVSNEEKAKIWIIFRFQKPNFQVPFTLSILKHKICI